MWTAELVKRADKNSFIGTLHMQANMIFSFYSFACKGIRLTIYCHLFDNYRLVSLQWDSLSTWITSAFAVDFFYYWTHRACHGILSRHLSELYE